LAVIGGCLGTYVVLAFVFHWLVEPTVAKHQEVAREATSPAAFAYVPPVHSEPAAVAAKPSATARDSKKSGRSEAAKPPMTVTRTSAPPPPMEIIRSEPPVRTASQPAAAQPAASTTVFPPVSRHAARSQPATQGAATPSASETVFPPVTAAQPASQQTASTESPAQAASEGATPDTVTAAAPAFPEAEEPKKPKKVRKTAHHQQQRDFFNPFRFFAWGQANGARRF
jgi:hypothetical protein